MSYEDNVYISPARFGVEILHCYDAYEEPWEFSILLVVRDKKTKRVYVATDSGCSCPTPFEDHKWPTDYNQVRTWPEVKTILDGAFSSDYRQRKPHDSLRRSVKRAFA